MRECELCKSPARMYCESDKAMLCGNCDERVHGANFLVEKHTRCLLCEVCQSPTPWKASGSKLCPAASVCVSCAENHANNDTTTNIISGHHLIHREESEVESHDDNNHPTDDDDDDDLEYEDGHTDDDEEEGDNQVVPWSSPPPAVACTSSSNDQNLSALKRVQHERDLDSGDEIGCPDLNQSSGAGGISDYLGFHRPMKQPRLAEPVVEEDEPNSIPINIFHRTERQMSGTQNA